jgi:putative transcriptional regulator
MSKAKIHECTSCGQQVIPERRNYRYTESGLSNVILQGIEVADCPKCGGSDVIIPRMAKIHRAIAHALANSPARLTGDQFRFIRKHLGMSGDQLGRYLHTDKTKISKWERGEDPIGAATDRLLRLIAAALDSDLRPGVSAIAEHLPQISDESGQLLELHVDVQCLRLMQIKCTVESHVGRTLHATSGKLCGETPGGRWPLAGFVWVRAVAVGPTARTLITSPWTLTRRYLGGDCGYPDIKTDLEGSQTE